MTRDALRSIATVFLLLSALPSCAQENPPADIPPDLTHVEQHGLSYTLDEEIESVFDAKAAKPAKRYIYSVFVKVKYADKRDPWEMKTPSGTGIQIGTVTEIGDEEAESKAAHQAFEIGQKWMARIRKAITTTRISADTDAMPEKCHRSSESVFF